MPKTAEEKFNEAVREGWNPNEVLNHMRNSKNDEYRSWVKQTWESPEAIPTPDGSIVSRIPEELDPELKDRLRRRKSQRQEKMDTAAGGAFQVPDWMFSPEFLTGAAGTAAGLGTAYTAAGAHAGMTPMEAAKGAASTFIEDVNQRLANRYKPVVQQASAAPAPQPTFPQATTQQSALPQGYGQQTMNAPTGAPVVPPTAGAGPQPVAPMTHEQLMQQEALEQARLKTENLRLKNQKLQTPATTAPASAKSSVSEADLKLLQQSGFNETSKQLQAKEAASKLAPSVDAINKNTPAAEIQGAVNVVKQQELKTGTGKPAIPGAAEPTSRFKSMYGSAAEVPKTHAFVPGAQYIDVLRNDLGQPTYTEQFSKREFPQTYLESVEAGKNINRELNRPTREQLKAQGATLPEPTEGITQKAAGKKLVKVGGVAGALIALSDLAKAETPAERNRILGESIMGAVLPPGMDVGIAGAPTLSPEQRAKQEEIALLGSPFYNTQAAKNIRQAKKVGAGRGIAPPSAYQR